MYAKDVKKEKSLLLTQLSAVYSFCNHKQDETKIPPEFEKKINSRLTKFLLKNPKTCLYKIE